MTLYPFAYFYGARSQENGAEAIKNSYAVERSFVDYVICYIVLHITENKTLSNFFHLPQGFSLDPTSGAQIDVARPRSRLVRDGKLGHLTFSLRSWRDFARECFCFSCEDVNESGEAVGGLVKSQLN